MNTKPTEKRYKKDDLEVIWQPTKCIHSKICWNGLEEVFNPNRRPWIDVNAADKETIMKQIDNCPSGALSYEYKNAVQQEAAAVSIQVLANGPLLIKGKCAIQLPDGSTKLEETQSALCRCGASANKPYCDGAHNKINFQG